jgi:two-component system phosphate regulon sensor histidine kinase PhoR
MSRRIMFPLMLCALIAGLFVAPLWSLREGLSLSLIALAGIALGLTFSLKRKEPKRLSPPAPTVLTNRIREEEVYGAARASTLLEATMSGMREGLLVIDEEARVIASNPAAREIFNGIKGRLERKRLSDLTRNPSIHAAFRAAFEKGERTEAKVEMHGAGRRVFDLRVVPLLLGDDQSRRGAIGVFYDITKLERLERVRQEFLSNVSHELRTPLTSILAFIETLEAGAIDERETNRRFLSIIGKSAARMHNLVNDVLELSAIEAGNVAVEPSPVRLYPVVTDVVAALAARADAREINVNIEVPSEIVVLADERQLEQMLTNLLDNAIKFNREGGTVWIRHERGERDLISVQDTGDGIPPEHIERIFERFYRIDSARSREMGGTGLGLAIVKHLARAQGGEARVHSIPGEGTTFTIELPALQ